MKLIYDGIEYLIQPNELICFDDNVPHAWEMNGNDLEAYYYRASSTTPIYQGTYCIDDLSFSN
nr:hypothetical protein cemce18_00030 [uncultured bacterium]